MERSMAALALTLSGFLFSLTLGAWWLNHTVFNPNASTDTTEAILQDTEIRERFEVLISSWVAPDLGKDQGQLNQFLEDSILTTRPGAAEAAPIIARVQALTIGDSDEQVVVTGPELVPIVRDQRANDTADLVLPFETISTLKITNDILTWVVLVSGGLGILCLIAGVVLRPSRNEVQRALAEFFAASAISIGVFGFVIPAYLLPALDNRTWMNIAPRLAASNVELTVGAIGVCLIGGAVMWMLSRNEPRRQWSTPLAAHRFNGTHDRSWSR